MRKEIEMQVAKETLTVEKGIEEWMLNCKRRGLSEKTIQYYKDITNIVGGTENSVF